MNTKQYFILVIIMLLATSAFAVTISLKSGTVCYGKITGYDKDNIYLQMNDSQLILIDKTLIESINSEKYSTPFLNSNKSSYPRNYSKYQKPDDLENYLKQGDSNNPISKENGEILSTEILNFSDSYSNGIRDALRWHKTNKWLMGGFATGLFLPVLGPPMISLAAPETYPDTVPANCDPNGYLNGYKKQTKIANRGAALTGGVIGTIATGIIIYFATEK